MFENQSRKQNGVLKVQDSSNEQLPTQKLANITKVDMYAIQYGDAHGKAHTQIAFRMGGAWYLDTKNDRGEVWAEELRPMSEWLAKQAEKAVVDASKTHVPKTDTVDVIGE